MPASDREILEREFTKAMFGVYERAKEECGYIATRFLQMVSEHGGIRAARELLASDGFSEGLKELYFRGRLDISMENLVLDPRWRELFSPEELAVARKRLVDLNFPVE